MSKNIFKVSWLVLLAVPAVLLFAAGCAEDDETTDEGVSGDNAIADEAAVTGDARRDKRRDGKRLRDGKGPHGEMGRHKMGHHKKGHCPAGKLLRYALKELDLTDEQRATLEALRDSKKEGKGAMHRDDRADFHDAFVQALETGKLDRAALEAKLAAKDELVAKKLEARNAKLATLHATLTPEQRQTLADTVRAKLEQKAEKWADKGDAKRKGHKGKRGHHGKMMFHGMLEGLELTAEQQAQIDALKAKTETQRPSDEDWDDKKELKLEELSTLLDAFVKPDFDPVQSAPKPSPMKSTGEKMKLHVEQFEALLGILTADQRAQLAEKIKSRGGKMGPGCKGMKGGCDGECPGNCPGGCMGDCPGGCMGDCPNAAANR